MDTVLKFLERHGIEYILHKHNPVFTSEDVVENWKDINGIDCKNLFLRSKQNGEKAFFLVSLPIHKKADLKKLAKLFGVNRLSFASEEDLMGKLGLTPGSVSPFGFINSSNGGIGYYLDSEVADAEMLAFHPNINTATLDLKQEDFRKFLREVRVKANIIKI